MLVTLFMVWCLGTSCTTIRDTAQYPMMACMVFGQHHALAWRRFHPEYEHHTLRRWRCEMGERI